MAACSTLRSSWTARRSAGSSLAEWSPPLPVRCRDRCTSTRRGQRCGTILRTYDRRIVMRLNLKQGARERRIAAEAVNEIFVALKPALDAARPAADAAKFMEENRGLIAHIFGLACDRHRGVTEGEATRGV